MKEKELCKEDLEGVCKALGISTEWLENRSNEPSVDWFTRAYFQFFEMDPLQRILFMRESRELNKNR